MTRVALIPSLSPQPAAVVAVDPRPELRDPTWELIHQLAVVHSELHMVAMLLSPSLPGQYLPPPLPSTAGRTHPSADLPLSRSFLSSRFTVGWSRWTRGSKAPVVSAACASRCHSCRLPSTVPALSKNSASRPYASTPAIVSATPLYLNFAN